MAAITPESSVLLPSLLLLTALAQAPSSPPAKKATKPAPAAPSKDAPKPVAAPVAATPPGPQTAALDAAHAAAEVQRQADVSLLRAILAAYEPGPEEIRVLAVEDLGLLGDPRALNVLADFSLDGSQAVQLAAVRAMRSIQHPRAEEILSNLARHPRPSEQTKLAALDALAYQRTPTAAELVKSISTDSRYGEKLQQAAKGLVAKMGAQLR